MENITYLMIMIIMVVLGGRAVFLTSSLGLIGQGYGRCLRVLHGQRAERARYSHIT